MANKKFKVGDLVQLKSGGAVMLVQRVTEVVTEDGGITYFMYCIWHDKKHRHNEREYHQDLLQLFKA